MDNIEAVSSYLKEHFPGYTFLSPVKTSTGANYYQKGNDYYRVFPFMEGSVSYVVADNPSQAKLAAGAFGQFSAMLNHFPVDKLHISIPDFHNLEKRFSDFQDALIKGDQQRIVKTKSIADELLQYGYLVDTYRQIVNSAECRKRVMHHDTKISNVLFNKEGQVICLVDLDTIMPGYFISDVGDMMRNYLSAAGEEETDFSKIEVRMDYYRALASGYLSQMGPSLTATEKGHFAYSGLFITYMQALRFYTDYILNDIYYPVSHPEHNKIRTQNQLALLEKLKEKEGEMQEFADALDL